MIISIGQGLKDSRVKSEITVEPSKLLRQLNDLYGQETWYVLASFPPGANRRKADVETISGITLDFDWHQKHDGIAAHDDAVQELVVAIGKYTTAGGRTGTGWRGALLFDRPLTVPEFDVVADRLAGVLRPLVPEGWSLDEPCLRDPVRLNWVPRVKLGETTRSKWTWHTGNALPVRSDVVVSGLGAGASRNNGLRSQPTTEARRPKPVLTPTLITALDRNQLNAAIRDHLRNKPCPLCGGAIHLDEKKWTCWHSSHVGGTVGAAGQHYGSYIDLAAITTRVNAATIVGKVVHQGMVVVSL